MGYYTRYRLSIVSGDDYITDYKQEISDSTDYKYLFDEEIKWYEHENDMITYSKKHPNVLFCLDGEGEENGDIWKAYFQNGKMFRTKGVISFEEFSINKLT